MVAGGGGLVRDSASSLFAAFATPLTATSSYDAEFQALLYGLRLALQFSDLVWIELDIAVVVTVLSTGGHGSAHVRHTIRAIRLLCRDKLVRFSHFHREGNHAADYLAGRGAQSTVLTFFDTVTAPRYLLSLVRMDQLGFPNFRFHYS
ncbi:hypothetical protein C2S51_026120 [Perilla frutescens var. frutescens]|nr:hypothetical protein C2S51_026120 [Perilla frutescens var. frutescens]